MNNLTSLGCSLLVVAIIYWSIRIFPKWLGLFYNLAFFIFMIYIMITRGNGQIISMSVVLILGEILLVGIYASAREDKKRKTIREMEKMKAKDFSHKSN